MMFIYKIIVVIELFLIYPLVFLNIRFGTAGLGTVGTILEQLPLRAFVRM